MNYRLGQTVPNSVITKLGDGGKVCVYAEGATDLVIDINGLYPAGSTFGAITPARLMESRAGAGMGTVDGQYQGGGAVPAGATVELQVLERAGVPPGAAAVVLNVTAVTAQAPGFLTVWPCGEPRPNASSVNYVTGPKLEKGGDGANAQAALRRRSVGGRAIHLWLWLGWR